jgi:hypothetical protein
MAPTGTYNLAGTTWSKWQIALVVGAPVAVGLGYWYLKRRSVAAVKKGSDEKSAADIVKQESIDGTELAPSKDKNKQEPPKSPLVSYSSQNKFYAEHMGFNTKQISVGMSKVQGQGQCVFQAAEIRRGNYRVLKSNRPFPQE